MDDLIHQGKVLYWGFSQWSHEQIETCLKICGDRYYAPISSQPCYNAINRAVERDIFPLCQKAGIGQLCYSPLAQGRLPKSAALKAVAARHQATVGQVMLA